MKAVAFFLTASLFALGFCRPALSRTIRVAIPGHSYVLALATAKHLGYYREYNLEVELVRISVGLGVKALVTGEVDFAAMGSGLFSAILGGAPVRIIMSSFHRPLFLLYGKPELKTLGELKKKKIGVPALGTAGHSLLVEILHQHGHSPEQDSVFVSIGSTENRLQALVAGVIDAAVLSPPSTFLAEEAGFHKVLSFIDQNVVFLGGGIGVQKKRLSADRILVENFTRATLKGHRYMLANESGMIPTIARELRVSETYARKLYPLMRSASTPDGIIDAASQRRALEPALRLRSNTAAPPLEKVFDFSLLRKLNADLKASGWKP